MVCASRTSSARVRLDILRHIGGSEVETIDRHSAGAIIGLAGVRNLPYLSTRVNGLHCHAAACDYPLATGPLVASPPLSSTDRQSNCTPSPLVDGACSGRQKIKPDLALGDALQ